MRKFKYKYISIFVLFLFSACKEDAQTEKANTDIPTPTKTYFVSATLTNELPVDLLKTVTKAAGQEEFNGQIKYDVAVYKLVYLTTYNGEIINASGLMYIPKGLKEKGPLLSLQHGTTFLKKDAPSVSGEMTGVEFFAAAGYISMLPDYIGYGASSEIFHPYYDRQHSALAVIDMVKSVKEFLTKEKIPFNDKLFLAGYSEGGYVTLAAAKEIEMNKSHDLDITAVAAGAGGYDLMDMLSGVTTNTTYTYPSYLAFVLSSYNNTYNWGKPMSYFFREKYAMALDTLMNGEYDGGFINSKLTTNVVDLLAPDFYESVKSAEGEKQLKDALKENSVSGWNSKLPIRLYHGTKDEIIPYSNSEITLANFKSQGSENVSLTLIPNGGHGSSFLPMLKAIVPWFEKYK